jgi:hypothetical protein
LKAKLKYSFSNIRTYNRISSKSWYRKKYQRSYLRRKRGIRGIGGFPFSPLICRKLRYKHSRKERDSFTKVHRMKIILIWMIPLINRLIKKERIATKKPESQITIIHPTWATRARIHRRIMSAWKSLVSHLELPTTQINQFLSLRSSKNDQYRLKIILKTLKCKWFRAKLQFKHQIQLKNQ